MASNVGYLGGATGCVDASTTIIGVDKNARYHQISTRKNGGSAGTLAISVRPRGCSSFETLTSNGAAVTMNLNSDVTYGPFAGVFEEMKFVAASFNGTSFDITVSGW